MAQKWVCGKTFLVLGGSSGIGLEIARELMNYGANIISVSKAKEEFDRLPEEIKQSNQYSYYSADLTRSDDRARIADILKNEHTQGIIFSIGIVNFGRFFELESEDLEKLMKTNYEAIVLSTREFFPIAYNTRSPDHPFYVAHVSSTTTVIPPPYFGAYPSSKAGAETFFASIKREFPKNVKLLIVRPSAVKTPLYDTALTGKSASVEELLKRTRGMMATPEAIGKSFVRKIIKKKQGIHYPDLSTKSFIGFLKIPIIGKLVISYYFNMLEKAADIEDQINLQNPQEQ